MHERMLKQTTNNKTEDIVQKQTWRHKEEEAPLGAAEDILCGFIKHDFSFVVIIISWYKGEDNWDTFTVPKPCNEFLIVIFRARNR